MLRVAGLRSVSGKDCVCELKNLQRPFPLEKLDSIQIAANDCTKSITSTRLTEVDVLMLGVQRRLDQLEKSVSVLENEDDGDLYGAVSLRIIELELAEIQVLLSKLKNTIKSNKQLSEITVTKVTYCTTSHQTTLHYTTPHHTTPHHTRPTTLHHTILHYTTPDHTTLHYTTLYYTTPHYTTPDQ
ncbi:hypothetical protein QTP70_010017 [Hemibagrus guttatus]|uniref:Uncharacterized protein n=1 Tax=Hemibagrus guttatus TaxID=175788 RepID=A0AAE0QXV6_9TELE|nr:hypothetical protein QTP70_010017 [Hemibagrus guttatus]